MKQVFIFTLSALLSFSCFAQEHTVNLRKVIQKSDLIIDIDDYRRDTVCVNGFTSKTLVQME